jgi:hypothetical protein
MESVSNESLMRCTNDILQERVINNIKHLYPAVAHHLPAVPSLDPSRGGCGAAMGNKKAKLENKKSMVDMDKNKRLDRIQETIEKQMKQQDKLQQVFKLRQMVKMAQALKNQQLLKKVKDEIEKLLLMPPSVNLKTMMKTRQPWIPSTSNTYNSDDDDDI